MMSRESFINALEVEEMFIPEEKKEQYKQEKNKIISIMSTRNNLLAIKELLLRLENSLELTRYKFVKFNNQFITKDEDEIQKDPDLYRIVFEPFTKNKEKRNSSKEEQIIAVASIIKNNKEHDNDKRDDIFNIFNTF